MTIQGARDELINMMECKDIPFYFVPILREVVKTIEMEIATVDKDIIAKENKRLNNAIEQIRAEIERLHYHPKLDFIKNDEVVEMALDIIDKYMKGEKE